MKVVVLLVLALACCADAASRVDSLGPLLRTEPSSAFDDMRFAESLLSQDPTEDAGAAGDLSPNAQANADILNTQAEEDTAMRAKSKEDCVDACEEQDRAEALLEAENQDELARQMKNRDSVMDEVKSLETLLRHAQDISSAIPAKEARLKQLRQQLGLAETGTLETQAKGSIQHKEHLLKKIEAEMEVLEQRQWSLGAEKQKIVQELKTLYLESKGLTADQATTMISQLQAQGGKQGAARAAEEKAAGKWSIDHLGGGAAQGAEYGGAASGAGEAASGAGEGEGEAADNSGFMFI